MKDIQQKLRDVQKDNGEIISRLTVKERECDVKTEEKVRFISLCHFLTCRFPMPEIKYILSLI